MEQKINMLFSIIVPVFRTEAYLEKCVRSLLDQTLSDLEIILVDDGSPDGCPRLCDAYAASDDRIRVIHKQNGGLSDARNTGLDAARGEYVIFVDADDYISPDTCARFAPYAHKGADILIGDADVIGGGIDLSHIAPSDTVYTGEAYLLKAFRKRGSVPMAAWLNIYRKAFLSENGLRFKCGILHEDEEFTPRAFLRAEAVICTGISFYRYVIHEDTISTQKDKRKNASDFYETCLQLQALYEKIEDPALAAYLLDSLSVKYLHLFQSGALYRYGKAYLHKDLVRRNARFAKTKAKALLFSISPRLYYHINRLSKK